MKFRRPAVEITAVQLTEEVAVSFNLKPGEVHYHISYKDERQRIVSAQTLAEEGFEVVWKKVANGAKKVSKPRLLRGRKALGKGLKEEEKAQVSVDHKEQANGQPMGETA